MTTFKDLVFLLKIHFTSIPHRDCHPDRDDDVDGEGCDHLLDCAPESYLILLDAMIPNIPITIRCCKIHIGQDVNQLVRQVTLPFKLRRCQGFDNQETQDVDDKKTGPRKKSLLQ